VVVCEDVSELKRHERDLELLKQVFARVFRHDLSNDLNVIRAHGGELLAANIDGPRASHAETIVRTCDDVIETSRKARAIEKLVDVDRDRYETDLVHVVSEAIEWLRANFEDVTVETDLPRDGFVLADGELELAIRCLLENAVVHNDSADPWVRITVTERADEFVLTVEDDGPGIRPNERHVFEDREVDPLSHSNGLGLWTVNWVVRNSGGDAHFEHTDRGRSSNSVSNGPTRRTRLRRVLGTRPRPRPVPTSTARRCTNSRCRTHTGDTVGPTGPRRRTWRVLPPNFAARLVVAPSSRSHRTVNTGGVSARYARPWLASDVPIPSCWCSGWTAVALKTPTGKCSGSRSESAIARSAETTITLENDAWSKTAVTVNPRIVCSLVAARPSLSRRRRRPRRRRRCGGRRV